MVLEKWLASSLPNADWIIGGDFNMVECPWDHEGGNGSSIASTKNQARNRCKVTLQIVDPNRKKRDLDYKSWFTWSYFRQDSECVQPYLDKFYDPKEGLTLAENLRLRDVLINVVCSDHHPICIIASFGQTQDDLTLSYFKLNISHLDSNDFHILVQWVWNLPPNLNVNGAGFCDGSLQCIELLNSLQLGEEWWPIQGNKTFKLQRKD